MDKSTARVFVAHPVKQHSLRLASALEKSGILAGYSTTVYLKPKTLTAFLFNLVPSRFKQKLLDKRNDSLPNSKIHIFCEVWGWIKLIAVNLNFNSRLYDWIKYHSADKFAIRTARYIEEHDINIVITYDDTSPLLFERLRRTRPDIIRVIDVSAANLNYVRKIFDKDVVISPDFAPMLHRQNANVWNRQILARSKRESDAADYFLSPSSFVSRSLYSVGVKQSQVLPCPLGVDTTVFHPSDNKDKNADKNQIRFVYVGGVKELKGISYLLKAFMRLKPDNAQLIVIGAVNINDSDIQPYLSRVKFTGYLSHNQIAKILSESDVFVFPSLCDGFGLSPLEAAATGLPVILSENTGVSDYFEEGISAKIVPIQSTEALQSAMQWFIDNVSEIESMGSEARMVADRLNWDSYDTIVAENMNMLVETNEKWHG